MKTEQEIKEKIKEVDKEIRTLDRREWSDLIDSLNRDIAVLLWVLD